MLSSLKGIIVEKKPDLDNIFDTPAISCLNVKDVVKRALFLEEFLVSLTKHPFRNRFIVILMTKKTRLKFSATSLFHKQETGKNPF